MARFMIQTTRNVSVRRARRRKPETVKVVHEVPVEIAEIDRSEIDLAMRVRLRGGTLDFFARDGRFICPLIHGGRRNRPAEKRDIAAFFAGGLDLIGWVNPFARKSGDEGPKEFPTDTVEIVGDDGDEQTRAINRLAAGFAIVDGNLWRPHVEPVWSVIQEDKNGPFAPFVVCDNDTAEFNSSDIPFKQERLRGHRVLRLDRAAEADKLSAMLAKRVRRKSEAACAEVEIHDASLLKRDDRKAAAYDLASTTVQAVLEGGWLAKFTKDGILAWVDLRDAALAGVAPDILGSKAARVLLELSDLELGMGQADKRKQAVNAVAPTLMRWTRFEGGTAVPVLLHDEDLALENLAAELAL